MDWFDGALAAWESAGEQSWFKTMCPLWFWLD